MTVRELADYLRVHVATIYRLVKAKQIPAFRLGGSWRFNRESIDDWRLAQDREGGSHQVDFGAKVPPPASPGKLAPGK